MFEFFGFGILPKAKKRFVQLLLKKNKRLEILASKCVFSPEKLKKPLNGSKTQHNLQKYVKNTSKKCCLARNIHNLFLNRRKKKKLYTQRIRKSKKKPKKIKKQRKKDKIKKILAFQSLYPILFWLICVCE